MSFMRRDKDQAQPQAIPATTSTTPAPAQQKGGGIVGWLNDSYNGIYKILLEPSMPTRNTIYLLLLGLIIGLIWAYVIAPVQFAGANPHRLNQAAQDQWILMVGGSYSRQFYNEDETRALLNQVENPASAVERMLQDPARNDFDRAALRDVQPIASTVVGTPAPVYPGIINEIINILIPMLLIVVIVPIVALVWRMLIYPNFVAPVLGSLAESRDPALKTRNQGARADLKRLQEQNAEMKRIKKETIADVELGEPVAQVLKVFTSGRNYDEADEIELDDKFLGQCGSVIPESVEPDPVAVEVWLFDMFSTGDQNHKKLFVTETAMADPGLRARLAAESNPNDWVIAKPGAKLIIDAEKLRLQAEMLAMDLNANGRFQNFRMKVSAWQKDGKSVALPMPVSPLVSSNPAPVYSPLPATPAPAVYTSPLPTQPQPLGSFNQTRPVTPAPAPVGARPLTDYDNIAFDPPPLSAAPRPLGAPAPSFNPPPAFNQYGAFPPDEEEDVFGATGDFTPLPPRQ